MNKHTQNLINELKIYLDKHRNDPNFWNRDPIGKLIKEFCEHRGNFKAAPRGNPKKGFQNMMNNKYENE